MLASIHPMYFLTVFLLDQGVYLGVKILRRDAWYWLPIENGPMAILLTRFVNKVVNDFAGIVQFRNPSEVGGEARSEGLSEGFYDCVHLKIPTPIKSHITNRRPLVDVFPRLRAADDVGGRLLLRREDQNRGRGGRHNHHHHHHHGVLVARPSFRRVAD